jgi:hypothetical protein
VVDATEAADARRMLWLALRLGAFWGDGEDSDWEVPEDVGGKCRRGTETGGGIFLFSSLLFSFLLFSSRL